MEKYAFFSYVEYLGIFAFAISGAAAAAKARFDIFGIIFVAYAAGCGGGILRDVLIGSFPPDNLKNIHCFVISILAAISIFFVDSNLAVRKLNLSGWVALSDSIGLSLFCVAGAQKAFDMTQSIEVALFSGMITAIGGGIIRDVLLMQFPMVLSKDIYAVAALVGAAIAIVAPLYLPLGAEVCAISGMAACFALRTVSSKYNWQLIKKADD